MPLLTTREAAICDAPTLSPTSSCFFGFDLDGLRLGCGPGVRAFFGRLKRSETLISLFRSTIA